MKDGDEHQRAERNHTGHALFTAQRIRDIHIFPPFIQTNSKGGNCRLYGERDSILL